MTDQYIRKVSLIVSQGVVGPSGPNPDTALPGIDLTPEGQTPLKITFRVYQFDEATPNTAVITIYNLSDTTAKQIQREFQQVVLQAGYENGNFGIIFTGTIKQVKRGRLNATDTFVVIFAADADIAHNFAFMNTTLKKPSPQDQADAIGKAMKAADPSLQSSDISIPLSAGTGGVLPRGKVFFGLASVQMNELTETTNTVWSIQNGKVEVRKSTAYRAGEAVVLNSRTGMLGVPEATNNGIEVTCNLNPNIKIGTRVKIDNAAINQTVIKEQGFPRYSDINFFASVTNDGFYCPIVVEHVGDTRGQEWETKITCLAIDASSPADRAVNPDAA